MGKLNLVQLGSLIQVKHGFAFKSEFFSENGPIVLTPGNFHPDGYLYFRKSKLKKYSGDFPPEYIFKNGDLALVMTDLSQECKILGKGAMIKESQIPLLHNQRIGKVVFKTNNLYTGYLYYYTLTQHYLSEIKQSATGSTVKHTSPTKIKDVSIPLPPLPEQKRIVAKLDGLFEKIDQAIGLLKKTINHTETLMGSVLDEEFRKLEANGIELKPISEFAKTKSGGTPKRSERQFWNGDIPWLKSGELDDSFNITENTEFITELGLQKSSASLFKNGTLLMAMYGATAGKLGILGMDACTNQAVCSIQNNKGLFDEIYVYFFLLSQRDRIIRESSGGAQPNISKGYIDKLEIPLPNIETQKVLSKKFFNYQNSTNSIVAHETQKLIHLKALKSSLLDQAFKGEL